MHKVVSCKPLGTRFTRIEVEAPEIAAAVEPGHMVMMRMGEQVLFTPHAITDSSTAKSTIVVVSDYPAQAVPETVELTGPVGSAQIKQQAFKVLFVAENLGIGALYSRLRAYQAQGTYTVMIAGYKTHDEVYWEDRLTAAAEELYVVTEDGSYGVKGPLRATVKAVCQHVNDFDHVLIAGSIATIKSCHNAASRYEIPTRISLAAAVGHNGNMEGSGAAVKKFDWHQAVDIEGSRIDFEQIGESLGLEMAR